MVRLSMSDHNRRHTLMTVADDTYRTVLLRFALWIYYGFKSSTGKITKKQQIYFAYFFFFRDVPYNSSR